MCVIKFYMKYSETYVRLNIIHDAIKVSSIRLVTFEMNVYIKY